MRDDIYGQGVGDAEIVQKLLEQQPQTLAQAYDIARRHETTKRAASHVTSLMQSRSRDKPERRAHAAVVRVGAEEVEIGAVAGTPPAPLLAANLDLLSPQRRYNARQNTRSMNWEEICCHGCSGIGHMKKDCPSTRKITKATTTNSDGSGSTVLHFKTHSQEMSMD